MENKRVHLTDGLDNFKETAYAELYQNHVGGLLCQVYSAVSRIDVIAQDPDTMTRALATVAKHPEIPFGTLCYLEHLDGNDKISRSDHEMICGWLRASVIAAVGDIQNCYALAILNELARSEAELLEEYRRQVPEYTYPDLLELEKKEREKAGQPKTLEGLFDFTQDAISEPYEVVRTIGFELKSEGGTRRFRLEAIKRPGKELSSVLVWEIDGGALLSHPINQPTLERVHPDLALRAMVEFIRQHYADLSRMEGGSEGPLV